jgi:hypothetical protein
MQSEWAELFIRYNKFWGGEPSEQNLAMIYTRKPRPPFREVTHGDGTVQKVWCTFDYEQIDIDVFSEMGANFIKDQLYSLTDRRALVSALRPRLLDGGCARLAAGTRLAGRALQSKAQPRCLSVCKHATAASRLNDSAVSSVHACVRRNKRVGVADSCCMQGLQPHSPRRLRLHDQEGRHQLLLRRA